MDIVWGCAVLLALATMYFTLQLFLYNKRLIKLCAESRDLYMRNRIKSFVVLGRWRPYLHQGSPERFPHLKYIGAINDCERNPVALFHFNNYRLKNVRVNDDELAGN